MWMLHLYINIYKESDIEKAEGERREREIPSRAFYGLRSPEASRKRPDEIGSTTAPTRVPRLMLSLSLIPFILLFPLLYWMLADVHMAAIDPLAMAIDYDRLQQRCIHLISPTVAYFK